MLRRFGTFILSHEVKTLITETEKSLEYVIFPVAHKFKNLPKPEMSLHPETGALMLRFYGPPSAPPYEFSKTDENSVKEARGLSLIESSEKYIR